MQLQFKSAPTIIFKFEMADLELAIPVSYLRSIIRTENINKWTNNWLAIDQDGDINLFKFKPKCTDGVWVAKNVIGEVQAKDFIGCIEMVDDWDSEVMLIAISNEMRKLTELTK
jgi:hypothetical protein